MTRRGAGKQVRRHRSAIHNYPSAPLSIQSKIPLTILSWAASQRMD